MILSAGFVYSLWYNLDRDYTAPVRCPNEVRTKYRTEPCASPGGGMSEGHGSI